MNKLKTSIKNTNCILVAQELHNIWRLFGNFRDYLAIPDVNLLCITGLFRSCFGGE